MAFRRTHLVRAERATPERANSGTHNIMLPAVNRTSYRLASQFNYRPEAAVSSCAHRSPGCGILRGSNLIQLSRGPPQK